MRGVKDLKENRNPIFLIRKPQLQHPNNVRQPKLLQASRDNGLMMLEAMLEAWGEKDFQKCFSSLKNIISYYNPKKSTRVSLEASQQPLFAVPEHMTHPVI